MIIHILASNRWSGVERYALDLCRHFMSGGYEVAVLTRDAKAIDNKFVAEGIPLFHAPLSGFFDLSSTITLARYLREKTSDGDKTVIHVHRFRDALRAIVARRLSRRRSLKVVMTLHNVIPGCDNSLYRFIYRHLDSLIFVSDKVRRRFLSTWEKTVVPIPEDRLYTLLNSIDLRSSGMVPEPEKGPVVAMYHGRLAPGKGLETLIMALSEIAKRTLRLRIVGSGNPDYVDSLRLLAQTTGVMESIDWRKHVDDPLSLIGEAHFGVLPSEEPEAFGLSNLEYMSSGRPVITTTNGGQTEYLTDGVDSFLVPPGDPKSLAQAMRTLARDRDMRMKMGSEARRTFLRDFDWGRFASGIEKIYYHATN